jgi:O-antigen/teichoic acid export membrane protein
LKKLFMQARSKGGDRLLRGFGAHGGAIVVRRAVQLAASVLMARRLSAAIVGEAALAPTVFEIFRIFAGRGCEPKVVARPENELVATCNGAHRLFWIWKSALVGIFVGAGFVSLEAAVTGLVAGQTLGAICNSVRMSPFSLPKNADQSPAKELFA